MLISWEHFFANNMRFFVALSLDFIDDNGQTIQTIMDKAFVCLCAQWHAWARGRGQLKIQTLFLLRLLCTIIGTFSVLNHLHHASFMHFDKLTHIQVDILQASPIYNKNLLSLYLHTCFHFFCKQCKCLSCALHMEWWSRPGASPTIQQPNSGSNALVSAGLTIWWPQQLLFVHPPSVQDVEVIWAICFVMFT